MSENVGGEMYVYVHNGWKRQNDWPRKFVFRAVAFSRQMDHREGGGVKNPPLFG